MPLFLRFICLSLALLMNIGVKCASTDTTYSKVTQMLLDNINSNPEKNISLVSELSRSKAFKSFNCFEQGKIYHYLGVSYYFLDEEELAISVFKNETLQIWRDCDLVSSEERANTIYNIGIAYQYTDKILNAKQYLDQSFQILEGQTALESPGMIDKFEGTGSYYVDIADYENAHTYYQRALQRVRSLQPNSKREFELLNRLLVLQLEFESFELGINYFIAANRLIEDGHLNISIEEMAELQINGSKAYTLSGDLREGERLIMLALNGLDEKQSVYLYSIALESYGLIQKKKGFLSEATFIFKNVISLRSLLSDQNYHRIARANAFENLSDSYLASGELDSALSTINKSMIELCNCELDNKGYLTTPPGLSNNALGIIRTLSVRSGIYESMYEKTGELIYIHRALEEYKHIDSLISQQIGKLNKEFSQIYLYQMLEKYYGSAVELSQRLLNITNDSDLLEKAYYFSAKSKALVLLNQMSQRDVFMKIADPKEKLIYQEFRKIESQQELALASTPNSKDSLYGEYMINQRAFENFIDSTISLKLAYESKDNQSLNPSSLSNVRKDLDSETLIIEYFQSKDKLYSFWTTNQESGLFYKDLENSHWKSIQKYLDMARDPETQWSFSLSDTISQILMIDKIIDTSPKFERIVVIPDGFIHQINFDVLTHNHSNWLIQNFDISYSYSNLFLFDDDRDQMKSYVGFASNYDQNLSTQLHDLALLSKDLYLAPFLQAEAEIEEVARSFESRMFIGEDATQSSFILSAADADVIHLSLHGLVNYDNPTLSCIIFDGSSKSQALTPSNLNAIDLKAELVILSSCHSASGKIYQGEGVYGMTRAFLASGAELVLSSLWSASEGASAQIIQRFTSTLKNAPNKANALRNAKLGYLESASPFQKHPFYWSNYILVGDIDKPTNKAPGLYFISFILIVIGLSLWFLRHKYKS